ncbi:MAG: hypothetical protein APF77_06515 [Clostridia bacterium BRH_c25]|nr:MAG: hypothetical protein APF77_06515 [Clostridia bacterium BRH_c25]
MDNKHKKAAALTYEQGETAPKITALGKGEVALRIIETAKENDVPVFENSGLVETLLQLEIGEQIPPELYNVVAEVLVFISNIDRLKGDRNG